MNILWKHGTAFAQITAALGSLLVEFYAKKPCPEGNPVKVLRILANRVAHTLESGFWVLPFGSIYNNAPAKAMKPVHVALYIHLASVV